MPEPKEAVVEIADLTKRYGERQAVDAMSFEVARGEIFGLLGRNGAGKTTVVECAQGLRRPDSGRVKVLGLDPLTERGRLSSRVGSQLQESMLPDRLRVGEAINLFADDPKRAGEVIDQWDLEDLRTSAFGDLSGGQQQRLFLALALINRPEVVFLDELTQGLDPPARRDVWELIRDVRARGATVVLVTHFMDEAESLCDRLVVMTAGRAVASGTPQELIEQHGSGVTMRFTLPDGPLDWIERLDGVQAVARSGEAIEVRGGNSIIAHLGAALVARGDIPDDLRVEHGDLEQAVSRLITADAVPA